MRVPEMETRLDEERGRVLVVEDEVLIRSFVADELREGGLQVIEAATADEAWAFLESGEKIDLVFSDVHMPGSMNGLDLARHVKAKYPHIRFIVTSGNLGGANVAGFSFLPKPYSFTLAVDVIIEALRK
jgi:CheY-like chemotaxis protein